jgi:hypothetical protein
MSDGTQSGRPCRRRRPSRRPSGPAGGEASPRGRQGLTPLEMFFLSLCLESQEDPSLIGILPATIAVERIRVGDSPR